MASIIQGRLGALASAHLLIRAGKPDSGKKQKSTLDSLVRAILAPHVELAATDGAARAVIEGRVMIVAIDCRLSALTIE